MNAEPPAWLRAIETITFDCYGTLVDWEAGMRAAFAKIPSLAGLDPEALFAARDETERQLEAGPFLSYAEVLARSIQEAGALLGARVRSEEAQRFAASIRAWPTFADTPDALARLRSRYRLGILSNVDRADLEATVAALGTDFGLLVTAEEVRSYKPRLDHWEEAARRLDSSGAAILHASVSPYHDLASARAQGWHTAWVHRGAGPVGAGAESADLVVPDLAALCAALGV